MKKLVIALLLWGSGCTTFAHLSLDSIPQELDARGKVLEQEKERYDNASPEQKKELFVWWNLELVLCARMLQEFEELKKETLESPKAKKLIEIRQHYYAEKGLAYKELVDYTKNSNS